MPSNGDDPYDDFDDFDEEDYSSIDDLEDWLDKRLGEYEFHQDCYYDDQDVYDSFPYVERSERRKAVTSNDISNSKGNEDDFYNSLMKLYVKDLETLTRNIKPSTYQVISGSGPAWFYEPTTRKLIKAERGSEIVVVPGEPDEQGRMMVRTMNTFILVPREEILDLGYN